MSKTSAVVVAVRSAIVGRAELRALVPAVNVYDAHGTPPRDPSVIIGEAVSVLDPDRNEGDREDIYLDLHIWKREQGLAGARAIAVEIRRALHAARRAVLGGGLHLALLEVERERVLRDPAGMSHGIVTVRAVVAGAV